MRSAVAAALPVADKETAEYELIRVEAHAKATPRLRAAAAGGVRACGRRVRCWRVARRRRVTCPGGRAEGPKHNVGRHSPGVKWSPS